MPVLCSVVYVTVPDSKTADAISGTLLEERMAACVNQIQGVRSDYWWEGKIEHSEEILLIIKTRTALLKVLMDCVKKNHPYAVPEIISFPIAEGNPEYLDWIKFATTPAAPAKK